MWCFHLSKPSGVFDADTAAKLGPPHPPRRPWSQTPDQVGSCYSFWSIKRQYEAKNTRDLRVAKQCSPAMPLCEVTASFAGFWAQASGTCTSGWPSTSLRGNAQSCAAGQGWDPDEEPIQKLSLSRIFKSPDRIMSHEALAAGTELLRMGHLRWIGWKLWCATAGLNQNLRERQLFLLVFFTCAICQCSMHWYLLVYCVAIFWYILY